MGESMPPFLDISGLEPRISCFHVNPHLRGYVPWIRKWQYTVVFSVNQRFNFAMVCVEGSLASKTN